MGLFLKTTIQIYLLNACNLDWGDNFFDFYVESKTSKIKMLINMWSPDLQVQLITLLNTFVCVIAYLSWKDLIFDQRMNGKIKIPLRTEVFWQVIKSTKITNFVQEYLARY